MDHTVTWNKTSYCCVKVFQDLIRYRKNSTKLKVHIGVPRLIRVITDSIATNWNKTLLNEMTQWKSTSRNYVPLNKLQTTSRFMWSNCRYNLSIPRAATYTHIHRVKPQGIGVHAVIEVKPALWTLGETSWIKTHQITVSLCMRVYMCLCTH